MSIKLPAAKVYGLCREGEGADERPYGIAGLAFFDRNNAFLEAEVKLDAGCYCVATLAFLWGLPVVVDGEFAQGKGCSLVYEVKKMRIAQRD